MSVVDVFAAVDLHRERLLDFHSEPTLVFVSVLVAMLSSMLALQMVGFAGDSQHKGGLKHMSLALGAFALGAGVWSMHFIGVLSIDICTQIRYQTGVTLLSMLPSLGAAYAALYLVSRPNLSSRELVLGGVVIGAGIGAMHYSGMAALQMPAQLRYDPLWFLMSIIVAVLLSIGALVVRFGLLRRQTLSARQATGLGGLFMGAAISGMHYTAMNAARFVGRPVAIDASTQAANQVMGMMIAFVALLIVVAAVAINGVLRFRLLFRQLADSQSRLESVVNTVVDGVITLDESGRILDYNIAASQIFGWTAGEVIGRDFGLIIHREGTQDLPGFQFNPRAFEDTNVVIREEVAGICKDCTVLPIRLRITRTSASASDNLYVVLTKDLSESRRLSSALAETELQYRSLVAQLPGIAFRAEYDRGVRKSRTRFMSDAVLDLTGWAASAFAEGEVEYKDIVHPDDLTRVSDDAKTALIQDQKYQLEYRIISRDGQERWVSESASVSRHPDGKNRIHGLILDITESKRRQAEFEGVVTAIQRGLMVIEFDVSGVITNVNDNFLTLTGYTREELIGQHHSLLCWPEQLASAGYEAHWAALRRGEFRAGEVRRKGKGDKDLWMYATYNPILSVDGVPLRIMKFVNDLSQRHAMEMDLREAKEKAELAAMTKSTFLANMSHEIRTPMNAIIGFTEVLLESPLQATQRKHLNVIDQSSRSLLSLLNDILDTAKLDHGAVQLEMRDFSLLELGQDLLATLQLQAKRKHIALRLDWQDGLPTEYRGDALRVRQVLLNLLGNAVKFTETGHVTLRVCKLAEEQGVVCEIEDSGIGIAPDRIAKIFEPFSQADASMTRRYGGTGLGTTIARQLTELMGGRIEVESELGKGSVFRVCLPLSVGQMPALVRGKAPPGLAPLAPMRVLVVDDVEQNRELLALRLGAHGHRVHCCENGATAFGWIRDNDCDLVLMDVQMPVMNGLDATRAIRAWEATQGRRRVPIIALTASVLDDSAKEAMQAGMDGYVAKPISIQVLYAEMARVLGQPLSSAPVQAEPVAMQLEDELGLVASSWPDLKGVDAHQARERWGDLALWMKQAGKFLEEIRPLLPLEASDASPPSEARLALAHRIKGAAANLALNTLQRQAAQLERQPLDTRRWLDLGAEVNSLMAQFAGPTASPAVSRIGEQTPADLPTLDRAELVSLRDHLRDGELVDTLLERVCAALPGEQRERIEQAINDFEFEIAADLVDALLESEHVA